MRSEFLLGIRTTLPLLLGVIPFGLVYGTLALSMGVPASVAQAMSWVIFAGSAQFVVAQLIGAGAPGLIIVITASIINLRHVLYSASIAPYLKPLAPGWKWLLAYLLTDEAYAFAITRYQQDNPATHKHWFFLGVGLTLWITWQLSTAGGILLGASLPASWSLDFTVALTFIALVVPALKDRASIAAAFAAGITAVAAAGLPYNLGLVVAALVGMFIGIGVEGIQKHATPPMTTEHGHDSLADDH